MTLLTCATLRIDFGTLSIISEPAKKNIDEKTYKAMKLFTPGA